MMLVRGSSKHIGMDAFLACLHGVYRVACHTLKQVNNTILSTGSFFFPPLGREMPPSSTGKRFFELDSRNDGTTLGARIDDASPSRLQFSGLET